MDTINKQWIENLNNKANLYENNKIPLVDFSNSELQYLIYWNWGYSGVSASDYTINAENELNARGIRYNENIAEQINELAEEI
jgi:hypothetical protein